jgi:hypothetical protein
MSDPRGFISFDFDHDEEQKNLFAGQCRKDSPTPFTVQDWSSKQALPEREWEALIRQKIGQCNMMIVLVSPTAYYASGIAKEIVMAGSQNVPTFGVYIKGAGAATALPSGLARNRVVSWSWPEIARLVRQMMTEGKNR